MTRKERTLLTRAFHALGSRADTIAKDCPSLTVATAIVLVGLVQRGGVSFRADGSPVLDFAARPRRRTRRRR